MGDARGVYMYRLLKSLKLGIIDRGSMAVATVAHDGWCGVFNHPQLPCDCDPRIEIRTSEGHIMQVQEDGTVKEVSA